MYENSTKSFMIVEYEAITNGEAKKIFITA